MREVRFRRRCSLFFSVKTGRKAHVIISFGVFFPFLSSSLTDPSSNFGMESVSSFPGFTFSSLVSLGITINSRKKTSIEPSAHKSSLSKLFPSLCLPLI